MKCKILILSPDIPFPLNMGGNVAQFYFAEYLSNYYDITYIFEIFNNEDEVNVAELGKMLPNLNIIKIYSNHYNSISKTSYIRRAFRKCSKIFDYLSNFSLSKQEKISPVKTNPIFEKSLWYLKPLSENFINKVSSYINENKPDIIQIEHTRFLVLSSLYTENIPKIFVHHELQFGMLTSAGVNDSRSNYTDFIIDLTKSVELSLLKKFNEIIVFNKYDQERLFANNIKNVSLIPFPIAKSFSIPSNSVFPKVDKLVFVGGDIHYANVDAIEWYCNDLGHDIFQKFGLKLHVIGNWNPKNIKLYEREFIVFEGFVENLHDALDGSIQIIPLRMGSGIRTKVLTSMAYRNPIISTKIGIEGIEVMDSIHYFEANSIKEFLNQIDRAMQDKELLRSITESAFEYVKVNYGVVKLGEQRRYLYTKILEDNVPMSDNLI